MRRILLTLFIAGIFVFGCSSKSSRVEVNGAPSDSLTRQVERIIQQKKELAALREEFLNGRIGRAVSRYKGVIKKYSKRYGFDWRLIVAQIVQESRFKEQARSPKGAYGLMQLMPRTASEISRELDIEYIMMNPRENIAAGIYHLSKQYRLFPDAPYADRIRLALASYNCGVGRIFDAQDIARYFKQPHNQWAKIRIYLTMLKSSDWELHLQVWPTGRPPHGYFYGYKETITYVDNIWKMYNLYRKIL